MSPLNTTTTEPSSFVMGWAPPSTSRIARRRLPRQTPSPTKNPSPSGPQGKSAFVMALASPAPPGCVRLERLVCRDRGLVHIVGEVANEAVAPLLVGGVPAPARRD